MKRKLRLGMIGTGVAARELYLEAWPRLRNKVEVVACTNRTRSRADDYAALASIPNVVDTPEQLLRLDDVDAVLISLPIDSQPKYVLKALRKGKAVLSEKPIAPSLTAGRRLVKSAARYDAPWLVGENFAFMPHVDRLQGWLDKGRLGEVSIVHATQITMMDRDNPYFHTAWRTDPKHVGGFVVDGGVHVAHILRRCFGMPTEIKGLSAGLSETLPPPDTAAAVMKFASGALCTWNSSFLARYEGPMVRVHGTKASAELFYDHVVLRDAKGRETVFESSVDSFQAQFAHFADVVLQGSPPMVTPEEALEDLQIVESIVKKPRKRHK